MIKAYLGIDLGTTGTKSMLFDEKGNVLGRGYLGYELISPFDRAFEQRPSDWVNAVVYSVKEAVKGVDCEVVSLSVSAQGGSFFFADEVDNKIVPLANAYTWMDKRAIEESNEIKAKYPEDYFYNRTGSRLSPGSMPARVLWARKNIPEIVSKAKKIVSTSDYIYYILTGKLVIDYTSAAMMDVYSVKTRAYDNELLSAIGFTSDNLPTLMEAGATIGKILPQMAKEMGISENAVVVCGAHDQYAANIGSKYFEGNDLLISSGTTWVVFGNSPSLSLGKSRFASCNHPAGGFGVFSSAVSSGVVIDWERNLFSVSYEDLNRELPLRPFEKDLLVYPFISGSGGYRGAIPLTFSVENAMFRFDKFDIIKATMEGVAFEIREIVSRFRDSGMREDKIIIAGGAVRSAPWMQILANVLGKEIYISNQADRCCFGAYSIARKGIDGNFFTFDFDGTIVKPQQELVDKYTEKFNLYSKKFKN